MKPYELEIERLTEANVPRKFQAVSLTGVPATVKTEQPSLQVLLNSFNLRPEQRKETGVIVCSLPQQGKTSTAVLLLKSYLVRYRNHRGAYITLREATEKYFADRPAFNQIFSAEALVLDDCASYNNEGCVQVMDYICRKRIGDMLFTVVCCASDETGEDKLSQEFGTALTQTIRNNFRTLAL